MTCVVYALGSSVGVAGRNDLSRHTVIVVAVGFAIVVVTVVAVARIVVSTGAIVTVGRRRGDTRNGTATATHRLLVAHTHTFVIVFVLVERAVVVELVVRRRRAPCSAMA